jgi:hypothetical protein
MVGWRPSMGGWHQECGDSNAASVERTGCGLRGPEKGSCQNRSAFATNEKRRKYFEKERLVNS